MCWLVDGILVKQYLRRSGPVSMHKLQSKRVAGREAFPAAERNIIPLFGEPRENSEFAGHHIRPSRINSHWFVSFRYSTFKYVASHHVCPLPCIILSSLPMAFP